MSVRLRNNSYPLHFHDVHGQNIKLSKNKTVACRSEGYCNGLVFSDRPVPICEPVYVKFLQTSPNWNGALRIGFTMNDPVSLKSKLPKFACPDLTSMPGNWAKAIAEKYVEKDSILHYYSDHNGNVHYGIGFKEYGIIFGGVNTSGKLWAVLDIYGSTVAVEFLDPSSFNKDYTEDCHSASPSHLTKERLKYEQLAQPLSFHSTHGQNVILKRNRSVVSKKAGTRSLAYVFTERPIEIGKTIIMAITRTDRYCERLLVYGLTSCDPKKINPHELPENAYNLLDRPEYWIVKQKSFGFQVGDTIMFTMNNQGLVGVTVNNDVDPILHVDYSQPLWIFVNLIHSIAELNLTGMYSTIKCNDVDPLEALSCLRIAETHETGNTAASGHQSSSECVICCEEQVNCALYRCGHMCMCYNCAEKVFRNASGAYCPICRENIHDIIKIYK